MFLYLLVSLVVSFFYSGLLFLNDYLSSKSESNFLSPIVMSLVGVMFLVIPIHLGLSLKMHILCILVVNVVGYAIYHQFRMHKK
ncbi:Uncharacterised protein [Moraxella ovis]|uniref:Uncharacterized protein n=1 Tax=Moraxella ovis TaxID=29433 RepID=A0A378PI65_9GAMM|nr:Uncharacterised protein [Moraxella ovis]